MEHHHRRTNAADKRQEAEQAVSIQEQAARIAGGGADRFSTADVDPEVASMQAIVDALEPLNEDAQRRILRWVEARYPL